MKRVAFSNAFNADFKEEKHKRDKDGKFSKSGSGGSSSKLKGGASSKKEAKTEPSKAIPPMSDDVSLDHINSLMEYTCNSFSVNDGLRKGKLSEKDKKVVIHLDEVIASSKPTTADTTVYRGISADSDFAKKLASAKVGDTFNDKAFMSTSVDKNKAKEYAQDAANGEPKKGGVVLEINVPKGTKTANLSGEANVMRYSNRYKFQNWRIDSDGMLRVTARVLADGVFPYLKAESPDDAKENAEGLVGQYIPVKEFTDEALQSLEGKPVIVEDHVWRTPENTTKDGLTVGSVAGTPRVEGGYVVTDLLITDKEAIEKIKSGELVEISSAYDGDCYSKEGVYKGKPFGAVQTNLRFNHVLLLPEGAGRCGPNVRIVNHKQTKEKGMKVLQRQYGNRRVDYKFNNEDDAAEAEKMVEDQKTFNADALAEAVEKAQSIKAQLDDLQSQYDAAMATIEEQKATIDDLMSAETQEAMAQEAAAQTEAEDAILDDAIENEVIEEKEKEEVKNECAKAKTFANRRKIIVQNAMSVPAEDLSKWTQDAIDGAFESLARQAEIRQKRANKRVMGGASAQINNSKAQGSLDRILRPMRLNNARRKSEKE